MSETRNAIRRVLSMEDLPDSTAAVVASMQDAGIVIDQVGTVAAAMESVKARRYDLILLDARMPSRNRLDVEAGPIFMRELKGRAWESENVETPFLVLSSFIHEIDVDSLLRLPGFLGVFNKASITSEGLEEVLGLDLSLDDIEDRGEFVVEDLLISESGDERNGFVRFCVPSWPEDEPVPVQIQHLPDDVSQELAWGDTPFYVWARVNIAAATAKEVRPRSFRLYVGDDDEERAFEAGGGLDRA